MANQVISAVRGVIRAIGETYRLGFRAWLAAPVILAIAALPELAQHVVEIRRGMFVSVEQFQLLAGDSTRWAFGYAKLAGMVIALLAMVRFWATGSLRATLTMTLAEFGRLALAIGLVVVASLAFDWIAARSMPAPVATLLRIASLLVQAGLTMFVIGALVGDRTLTIGQAFTGRWPSTMLLALLMLIAFMPAQLIHMLNHKLAIGAAPGVVWALMIWDALVVGTIAALIGSALWVAYRSGATWAGWGEGFMPAPGEAPEPELVETGVVEPVAPPPPAPVATPAPAAEDAAVTPPRRRRPRPGPRPRG